MDRREIQKRRLAVEAHWNLDSYRPCHDIGRVGCHDITVGPQEEPEILPGEPYHEINVDNETGAVTVTNFDGQRNEIHHD